MINVETTPVVRRLITHNVTMVGQVEYDETRLAYIKSYVDGRLDRLFVEFTGIEVRKQDHLVEIYSPELLASLTEIHEARQTVDRLGDSAQPIVREAAEAALNATRERLRLFGLTQKHIESAEAGEFKGDHITLYAPIGGIVIEKNAKQGSYVKEGDRIYTIADLSKVWVMLEAYESDLPWLRHGQKVRFTVQPFGDEVFEGTIAFVAPVLDRQQRTVQVCVNVDNADGRLRPGMFVRGAVEIDQALRHGAALLLRVVANTHLLRGLLNGMDVDWRIESGLVHLWPLDRQRTDQPPLTLRLVRVARPGFRPVVLLTSVLDPWQLSDAQLAALYEARWGMELRYRSIKQTLHHHTLRSHAPDTALLELWGILFGMAALLRHAACGARISVGKVRRLVQRLIRRPGLRVGREAFQLPVDENRRACKSPNHWPRKKTDYRPPGEPIIQDATPAQRDKARALLHQQIRQT